MSLERALRGLLEPARLLDYIEDFTVFEEGKGGLIKKTAKNHQLLGFNKSIARLVELRETGKLQRKRLVGYATADDIETAVKDATQGNLLSDAWRTSAFV